LLIQPPLYKYQKITEIIGHIEVYCKWRENMMQGMITDPEAALKFMLSGKVGEKEYIPTVTFRSQKTGNHFTYKIKPLSKKEGMPPAYFVSVLSGPDNENDYTYVGMIFDRPTEVTFNLTKGSKFNYNSPCVIAISWVIEYLACEQEPPMTEIYHEGRCGVCGRTLTTPESCLTGIGPICAAKM